MWYSSAPRAVRLPPKPPGGLPEGPRKAEGGRCPRRVRLRQSAWIHACNILKMCIRPVPFTLYLGPKQNQVPPFVFRLRETDLLFLFAASKVIPHRCGLPRRNSAKPERCAASRTWPPADMRCAQFCRNMCATFHHLYLSLLHILHDMIRFPG